MRITKETQAQLGGIDRDVQCDAFLQGEAKTYLYQLTNPNDTPIDISDYVITFRLIERAADYVSDTKNGLSIINLQAKTGAVEINLDSDVTILDAVTGLFQVYVPATVTTSEPADPDSTMPILYTGYVSIDNGGSPTAEIFKQQYLFTVSNDGI